MRLAQWAFNRGDDSTALFLERFGPLNIDQAEVLLRSLREGIDYSTATGRMLADIFAALAAYERKLMHERDAAAREASRARGRHTG